MWVSKIANGKNADILKINIKKKITKETKSSMKKIGRINYMGI